MNNTVKYLGEIRKRSIICIIAFLLSFSICFVYVEKLNEFIKKPIGELTLIFTTPSEALLANIRIAAIFGFVITLPILIYQVVAFIYPALYENETKLIMPMIISTMLLFVIGVSFAYFIVYPFTIKFFLNFSSDTLLPYLTISSFISFITNMLITFGLIFQLPCIFWFLGRMGILKPEFLKANRKYALLGILVMAAVITPPDVVSQLLVGIPLYVLYEIGIWAVSISSTSRKKLAN